MELKNKTVIIKILNPKCHPDKQLIPSYSHVVMNGENYCLTDSLQMIPYETDDCYMIYNVEVSGTFFKSKGFMPNPLAECNVCSISTIAYL